MMENPRILHIDDNLPQAYSDDDLPHFLRGQQPHPHPPAHESSVFFPIAAVLLGVALVALLITVVTRWYREAHPPNDEQESLWESVRPRLDGARNQIRVWWGRLRGGDNGGAAAAEEPV